ncbi:hypothetical protein [Deinococcus ficus]|jgi:hypothetical protein|uniref:Uncharacterized protein n=1 Tax=Deinococcus ficus TaxID=317577 RepID=A0A221T2E2_9DEIO|nr:hypothetical protein [Deinococcus ficus]ASN83030.1 hypothetical protein DFI_17780 [Deinococcus ficus]
MLYRPSLPERFQFGSAVVQRVLAHVGAQTLEVLVQEARGASLLRRLPPTRTAQGSALSLRARSGAPVAAVQDVQVDEPSGHIRAYVLRATDGTPVTVPAEDTYWWRGELYGTSRALRAVRRSGKPRRAAAQRSPLGALAL